MSQIILDIFNPYLVAQFLILGGFIFIAILVFAFLDLVTGIRKAKKLGEYRTSKKLRRTLEKLNVYGIFFTLCFIADSLISVAFHLYSVSSPAVPFISLIEALYICFIEYKSIVENTTNPKDKQVLDKADDVLIAILKEIGPDKIREIANKIQE